MNVSPFSLTPSALHPNDWQSLTTSSHWMASQRMPTYFFLNLLYWGDSFCTYHTCIFKFFLSHVLIQIGCLVFTLESLYYCFSSVQRIAPACFHAYSATVNTLTSVPLKYLSESEHLHCTFCLHDSFAMGFFASCFNLFQLPFYLLLFLHFFFSPPFVNISVKFVFSEYSHSWPHTVSFPSTLFVCMCPIFAYFSSSVSPPGQH